MRGKHFFQLHQITIMQEQNAIRLCKLFGGCRISAVGDDRSVIRSFVRRSCVLQPCFFAGREVLSVGVRAERVY
jgi:hypothetical protein